jgi:hypothetical protein
MKTVLADVCLEEEEEACSWYCCCVMRPLRSVAKSTVLDSGVNTRVEMSAHVHDRDRCLDEIGRRDP